jgi:DSF synthase
MTVLFCQGNYSYEGRSKNMAGNFFSIFQDYKEISVRYDAAHRAIWCYHNPNPRPCFSIRMLTELRQMQQGIMDYFESKHPKSEPLIRYQILISKIPGIFSMGGDLALFSKLIKHKNRQKLLDYATKCIDTLYLNSVNLNLPITTISLVEGTALGGGFECALSSNTLIATENAEMGFPEIRFNLFPGMGAYSFIARTCGIGIAGRMLSSGTIYGARELYDMGVVDYLGETGNGMKSVENYMRQHQQVGNGHRAIQQVRQRYHPMDYQELADITELWADAALRLQDKDLRLIDRLVKAQSVKMTKKNGKSLIRTKQDRRFITKESTFPLQDWSGETIMFDRRRNPDRRLFH